MDNLSEKEITLNSIANHCKESFTITRGKFSEKIFGNREKISRIIKDQAERKITDKEYQKMFDYIKSASGGTSASFVEQMHKWFPSLKRLKTEEAIIRKIRSELDGESLDDAVIIEDMPVNYSTIEFIRLCTENVSSIRNLYLVAQTGWEWLDDRELNSVLMELAQSGKRIIIITNPETQTTINIADALKDEKMDMRYMSLNDTLAKWHAYEERFRNIEIKVSSLPILHQTVILELEGKKAYASVRIYTYGTTVGLTPSHIYIKDTDSDYDYYYKEFNYLRTHAKSYTEWLKSSPGVYEEMPDKDYVLLYPTHKETRAKKTRWVFSALSILKNNAVSLKVNMSDSYELFTAENPYEYEYHGSVILSSKMIFLSMTDTKQVERVSISFSRPVKNNNSFIGVLTALSPGGVPLSFKCACFEEDSLKYINYDNLFRLLAINETESKNNLIKIGSEDIEEFYSDSLLK